MVTVRHIEFILHVAKRMKHLGERGIKQAEWSENTVLISFMALTTSPDKQTSG